MALLWVDSCQRLRTIPTIADRYWSSIGNWHATGGRDNGPKTTGVAWGFPKHPKPSGDTFIGHVNIQGNSSNEIIGAGTQGQNLSNLWLDAEWHLWANGGDLELRRGATVLGTAAGVLDGSPTTRYSLAVKVKIHGSDGTSQVYLDGVELPDLTLTGINTSSSGNTSWNCFFVSGSWCDVAILDTTNPSGDDPHDIDAVRFANVDYLPVDNNGYVSGLTGSDGNSTDNYLLVDDTSPDDDTTYVGSSSPAIDGYGVADITFSGRAIKGVAAFVRGKKTTGAVGVGRAGVRLSGTNYYKDSFPILTDYAEIVSYYGCNPSGGVWVDSAVNGLEAVADKEI